MPDSPGTWFRGLMAERAAAFPPDPAQAPFFLREIAKYGQPVLDLGCGTGRLLLPLLRAGVDVDGCDISADMLRFCRESAGREGFAPRLYCQPMHAIDLPRRYRAILICASFNLAGDAEQGLAALRSCYEHLEEGGALLFDISAAYASPEEWEQWEPARGAALPEPWPAEGRRRVAADGSEYVERFRLVNIDPLAQRIVRQVRVEKWVAGRLVDAQELTMHGTLYLPGEVRLMLRSAGFQQVAVRGDFTDSPATPESKELVFTAVK